MSNTLIYDGKKILWKFCCMTPVSRKNTADELRRYLGLISGIPDVVQPRETQCFRYRQGLSIIYPDREGLGATAFVKVLATIYAYGGKRGVLCRL